MQRLLAITTVLLLMTIVKGSSGRPGYGLIGYGISMYKPPCAYACKDSISNQLNCDDHDEHGMHMMRRMSGMNMEEPTPESYASNEAYLQTLAYCMSMHCSEVEVWKLERFWEMNVAGRKLHQPSPKMSHQEALESIVEPPTAVIPADEMLNGASILDEDTWLSTFNGEHTFEINEERHSRYSLALFLTCVILPMLLSCFRWLPVPGNLVSRFSAAVINPPLLGCHHQVPFLNGVSVPTRGQGLFIGYLLLINVILSAVGYEIKSPNSWYEARENQIANFVANRTGALSAVNLSLLVLFAGRNSFLLWLTNWSHSTFLLMHRWIGVICAIQACLHSAMYLQSYVEVLRQFGPESELEYWSWGVVSTIAIVALLPASMWYFRKRFYELFLATHILLAFFALIGYYYHIYLRFGRQWGYELWAYIAFAIWAFDRVARVFRVGRNGVKTGCVTVVDEDYVRLDIPGVSATGQAYLYFPTLTWRVWENHPFSVAGSMFEHQNGLEQRAPVRAEVEKARAHSTTGVASDSGSETACPLTNKKLKPCLTFFIRTHTGLTRHLRTRSAIPVLIEASYGHSLLHDQRAEFDKTASLVCIAGGVGITAIFPILAKHGGNRSLYWGLRNRALVEATQDLFDSHTLAGARRHVAIGERLDLQSILEHEIGKAGRGGERLAVVVSGPPSMADEVRSTVARLARECKRAQIVFVEESYSW